VNIPNNSIPERAVAMKIYHRSFVIMVIIVALFGFMNVHARAIQQKSANHADEEKIREVIQNYFDRRYGSRAVNQIGDIHEPRMDLYKPIPFSNPRLTSWR
jgi:hypothetical protein